MTELEGVTIVLPAHGHPFTDVADRAKAIRRHHEERLDKLRARVTRDRRVRDASPNCRSTSSRRGRGARWPTARRYAHLEHLRLLGDAECRSENGKLLYEVG